MTASSDDNPFVIEPRRRRQVRPWLRAIAMVALCIGGVYILHEAAQSWLISRLANDLSSHPPHVQIERLGMLAQFGAGGLPNIASALASPDDTVSAAAFQILSDMQGRWQTSRHGEAVRMNRAMVDSLQAVVQNCPAECRHRIAELLNQTIVDTVDSDDDEAATTYRLACALLSDVTGTETPAPGALARRLSVTPAMSLSAVPGDPGAPDDRVLQLEPLPINPSARIVPGSFMGLQPIDDSKAPIPPDYSAESRETTDDVHEANLQPIEGSAHPSLVQINRGSLTVTPVHVEAPMADDPLAAYETRSVIDFVGSRRPTLNEAADRELRKRGFNDGDMELAMRLTSTDVRVRLAMVEELPSRSDVDPRKWLIWLAGDAERDVRLQAISRLGTMDDPEVQAALRERLQEERDPTVATRLRRFLGLR